MLSYLNCGPFFWTYLFFYTARQRSGIEESLHLSQQMDKPYIRTIRGIVQPYRVLHCLIYAELKCIATLLLHTAMWGFQCQRSFVQSGQPKIIPYHSIYCISRGKWNIQWSRLQKDSQKPPSDPKFAHYSWCCNLQLRTVRSPFERNERQRTIIWTHYCISITDILECKNGNQPNNKLCGQFAGICELCQRSKRAANLPRTS